MCEEQKILRTFFVAHRVKFYISKCEGLYAAGVQPKRYIFTGILAVYTPQTSLDVPQRVRLRSVSVIYPRDYAP